MPHRLAPFGLVAGAVMALGLASTPGIALGLDDIDTAPAWIWIGSLSWLGTYVLFPIWTRVDGRFELIASLALLTELRDVLDRPRFRRWVGEATATQFIDGLAEDALIVDDPPALAGLSPDPDDDYLIALARAAQADSSRSALVARGITPGII